MPASAPVTQHEAAITRNDWSRGEPRQRRALSALVEVARAVNRSLDADAVLVAAADAVAAALGNDGVLIRLLDPSTGRLTLAAARGVSDRFADELRVLEFGQGLAGQVVLSNTPLIVEDVRRDPRLPWPVAREEGLRSVAVVPIHARDSLLGTLATFSRRRRHFGITDLELLQTVADQVGIAIENARLYRREHERAAELEALAKLKSDFAATVSHELRTPMTVVKTSFDGLMRNWWDLSDVRRLEYLRAGQAGADRLKRLLENLLLVSRIEDRRVHLRLEPVDTARAATTAIAEISARYDRAFELTPADDLPAVYADRASLVDVLLHLLDNAARYSCSLTPITVSTVRDGQTIVLAVRDRGVGIAPEDLPRLFDRFERADRTVRSEAGTGVGLYIARRLVEAMGGEIWVESEVDVGSVFSIRLPIAS